MAQHVKLFLDMMQIIKADQTLAKPNEMGDIVVKLLCPKTFQLFGMQIKDIKKIICQIMKGIIKPMMQDI